MGCGVLTLHRTSQHVTYCCWSGTHRGRLPWPACGGRDVCDDASEESDIVVIVG